MGTIDGPIALAQPALDFDALARLRDEVRVIREQASPAFANYRDAKTGGYFHLVTADAKKPNAPGDPSWASTATVVSFLIRSGQWPPAGTRDSGSVGAQKLINHFVRDPSLWESAGLPLDNPFTLGFALELVIELLNAGGSLDSAQRAICISKLRALVDAVSSRGGTNVVGRVSCRDEVPNSYLTDLAVRVLDAWRASKRVGAAADIPGAVRARVRAEAINSINEQMALLLAERPGAEPLRADVFELGYAVVLVTSFGPKGMTPELRTLLREALSAFFGAQRPDGSWPRSRRLFTYPTYGDAYCFDFEFLARLLRAFRARTTTPTKRLCCPTFRDSN